MVGLLSACSFGRLHEDRARLQHVFATLVRERRLGGDEGHRSSALASTSSATVAVIPTRIAHPIENRKMCVCICSHRAHRAPTASICAPGEKVRPRASAGTPAAGNVGGDGGRCDRPTGQRPGELVGAAAARRLAGPTDLPRSAAGRLPPVAVRLNDQDDSPNKAGGNQHQHNAVHAQPPFRSQIAVESYQPCRKHRRQRTSSMAGAVTGIPRANRWPDQFAN